LALFYLIFWTTFAQVCFCKSFGNLFKTFANSQRYRNMIARSIFGFEISPPVPKVFPLTI
jgi:hypothetical protein